MSRPTINEVTREELEQQIKAYLDSGGIITQVPKGSSRMIELSSINPSKKDKMGKKK